MDRYFTSSCALGEIPVLKSHPRAKMQPIHDKQGLILQVKSGSFLDKIGLKSDFKLSECIDISFSYSSAINQSLDQSINQY